MFHTRLLLKKTDLTEWRAVLWRSLPMFTSNPLPSVFLKTGMTPWMEDTWPGCLGSVSPQTYDNCWGACPFSSHLENQMVFSNMLLRNSVCLLIPTDNTRCYLKKVATGLEHNVHISVGPGRHPCVLLLSKLALYFCQIQIYALLQPFQILAEYLDLLVQPFFCKHSSPCSINLWKLLQHYGKKKPGKILPGSFVVCTH